MPETYHVKIYQGATYKAVYALAQPDGKAVDLNGFTVTMEMKEEGGAVITPFTTEIISPKNLGRISVSLTAQQTALLTPGRYFYTLDIESGGVVERVLEGFVLVLPGVVR